MAEKREKLFEQFPPVSTAEWKAKVEADLKGAPFDKKLVWRTNEGFNLQPMYRLEDIEDLATTGSLPGQYPYLRGNKAANNEWLVAQDIEAETVAEANAKALDAVSKGVQALAFRITDPSAENLDTLLAGLDLKTIEVNFTCCLKKALPLAEALAAYAAKHGLEKELHGSIDFNPYKKPLRKNVEMLPEQVKTMALALNTALKTLPSVRFAAVDSVMLADAGCYIYQELGYALSWGASWLTLLTDAGLSADEAASRIRFNMGVGSNFFMELSKFRAARMLWAQIVAQYKPAAQESCKMHVHAITSRYNQTLFDAHVNLLRSQTEAMSAALAGVESITVTPFDVPYKNPDEFSERIARNQQHLLKEESHLDKVADPAGGSYYVETLTVALAKEAWKLFLDTDAKGGFLACCNDGSVAAAVRESSEKRHTDVARRKEILLGTNQYPNINERATEKIEQLRGALTCACGHNDDTCENPAGLPVSRAASDFEALRLATEASAHRPKVFMLTIGNLAMRLARAQFSSNFFGCAGYEIIDNLGFNTVQEGIDAALEKKADIVVLCSSDDEYAELAPEAFKYLDGRAEFVVAGAPACMDDLKAAGITEFVHVRCNVLDTLKAFNARLLK